MHSLTPPEHVCAQRARETMGLKHQVQIEKHEQTYGKLGELMTDERRKLLIRANKRDAMRKAATS